jgi:hypothetical protein
VVCKFQVGKKFVLHKLKLCHESPAVSARWFLSTHSNTWKCSETPVVNSNPLINKHAIHWGPESGILDGYVRLSNTSLDD